MYFIQLLLVLRGKISWIKRLRRSQKIFFLCIKDISFRKTLKTLHLKYSITYRPRGSTSTETILPALLAAPRTASSVEPLGKLPNQQVL